MTDQEIFDKAVAFFEEAFLLRGLTPRRSCYLIPAYAGGPPCFACLVGAGGYHANNSAKYMGGPGWRQLVIDRCCTFDAERSVDWWTAFVRGCEGGFEGWGVSENHLQGIMRFKSAFQLGYKVGAEVWRRVTATAPKEERPLTLIPKEKEESCLVAIK